MMRTWIGMAGGLLLILPQIALAQDHHGGGHDGGGQGREGRPDGGGHPGGGDNRGGGGGDRRGGAPGGGNFGGGDNHHGGGDIRGQAFNGGDRRGDNRGNGFQNGAGAGRGPGFASVHPEGRNAGGFRGNFPRAGNNGWHRGFYAGQRGGWDRIRGPRYTYPRGYGYRRWGLGAILPGLLFGSAYYWNDYGSYGVYPPPPGDRWVRYGPDLLLINIRSGRVDDAIYGAFY